MEIVLDSKVMLLMTSLHALPGKDTHESTIYQSSSSFEVRGGIEGGGTSSWAFALSSIVPVPFPEYNNKALDRYEARCSMLLKFNADGNSGHP